MRKLLLCISFLTASIFTMNAQEISKNAIGIRFGDNNGIGAEVSYQRALGSNNRLEIDLGIRGNSDNSIFKATGLYQWVWELEDNFNWYAGVGGGLANYNGNGNDNFSETFIFAAGDIGIEYNFDSAPILLSLDLRPEFGFGDNFNDYDNDIAFSIRYQF